MTTSGKVAVVAGAGPGNGAALAKRFAVAGYTVAMLARDRDSLDALQKEIKPAGVAETAYHPTCQDPSAWSFEVEARPFAESW